MNCGTCARKGYDVPAQINADGGATGLCDHHNEYERLLRAALRAGAPLTPEKAQAIRMDVTERMRLAR